MDTVMLSIKFLLFFALEFAVLAVIGAVLVAGLYQIVRDKVRESRRQDQIAPESRVDVAPRHS
jgi:Na+-translocating ferredoxin:NAD+ oxidoreductase RnfG subunit